MPKKKSANRKLQDELWAECRRIMDTLYPALQGSTRCFLCGKAISGSGKQLGHFIPRSTCGAYLKYDLRNLRWSCYYDNINLGGNGSLFYKRLVEEKGQDYVDQLFKDKEKIVKSTDYWTELLAKYKEM